MLRTYQLLLSITLVATGLARGATIVVETVVNTDEVDGLCTLREAIVAANTNSPVDSCVGGDAAGRDHIVFAFVPQESDEIVIGDTMPDITSPVVIDGLSVPGARCTDQLEVRINSGSRAQTLDFQPGSDGSLVRGLHIYNNLICGNFICNDSESIRISGARNIAVQCNLFGLSPDGWDFYRDRNDTDIEVHEGVDGLIIGTDSDGINDEQEGNVFYGHFAVELFGSENVRVSGNAFHPHYDTNGGWGISVNSASHVIIGVDPESPTAAAANDFAGSIGVYVEYSDGQISVLGNDFGLPDISGRQSNLHNGVYLRQAASGVEVGRWDPQGDPQRLLGNRFVLENIAIESGQLQSSGVTVYDPYLGSVAASVLVEGNAFIGLGALDTDPYLRNALSVREGGHSVRFDHNAVSRLHYGVRSVASSVTGESNCFDGNQWGAVSEEGAEISLISSWWGSDDGPGGAGAGQGDPVSPGVAYTPHASEPLESCALLLGRGTGPIQIPLLSAWSVALMMLLVPLVAIVRNSLRHDTPQP